MAVYKARFEPLKKTFGGMEAEEVCGSATFTRLVTIGPKKYACITEDGSYHWNANGVPAKQNTRMDVLRESSEPVLDGETVNTNYFSINAGANFQLAHTTGATKKLRFICLKGAVENGGIRWWKNYDEFAAYAGSLVDVGHDVHIPYEKGEPIKFQSFTEALEGEDGEDMTVSREVVRQIENPKQKRPNPKREERESFVYILREKEGVGTYVGYSPWPEKRLRQHNGELSGGAQCTEGRQWEHALIVGGFEDQTTAKRFESALQHKSCHHVSEWLTNAQELMKEDDGTYIAHKAEKETPRPAKDLSCSTVQDGLASLGIPAAICEAITSYAYYDTEGLKRVPQEFHAKFKEASVPGEVYRTSFVKGPSTWIVLKQDEDSLRKMIGCKVWLQYSAGCGMRGPNFSRHEQLIKSVSNGQINGWIRIDSLYNDSSVRLQVKAVVPTKSSALPFLGMPFK